MTGTRAVVGTKIQQVRLALWLKMVSAGECIVVFVKSFLIGLKNHLNHFISINPGNRLEVGNVFIYRFVNINTVSICTLIGLRSCKGTGAWVLF